MPKPRRVSSAPPPKPPVDTLTALAKAPDFAARVVIAYRAAGFNRHSLARELGCAYTTILAWEAGTSIPKLALLRKLSVAVGVPTSVLTGEDSPVNERTYEAWREFLDTDLGRSMSESERKSLGSMWFSAEDPATVERYRSVLAIIRGTRLA